MINSALLSLEQTPPLSVPMPYFLAAPVFMAAGALMLLWHGADAFGQRWTPALLASTHMITLGFLAMVMMGAIQQLLPVLLGASISRPRLFSQTTFVLLSGGTVALCGAFLGGIPTLFNLALILLAGSLLLFIPVIVYALLQSKSSPATRNAMLMALVALGITLGLGGNLAAGYGWDGVGISRQYTDIHLSWGLLGWVGLLLIGVAYQVVPMFQITPEYPPILQRWLAPSLFAALLYWSLVHSLAGPSAWLLPGTLALLGGMAAFAVTTLVLQQRRKRRLTDITVSYWRLAMVSLLAALLLWVCRTLFDLVWLEVTTGIVMIVGFAVSAVIGMLYKIVPFLVWLHMNNQLLIRQQRTVKLPNMKQLIPGKWALRQYRLHLLSLTLLALAPLWPAYFSILAPIALFLSAGLLGWNLLQAVFHYHRLLNTD